MLGQSTHVRTRVLLPNQVTDVLGLLQLAILAAFGGIWLYTRRGTRSERQLRFFETAGTLSPILFVASALFFSPVYLRPELLVLLGSAHALIARAVMIPSTARRTLVLGLCVQATLVVGTYAYYVRAAQPNLPEPWLYTMVVIAWSSATVAICTLASYTIFGLREQVREVTELGQYRLEEKLGEGGMGIVYRASHVLLRRPTAVKLLPPEKAAARDLLRFEREVQVTASLTHPNTVAIYDYGRTPDGIFYYAMEYLEGLDLEQLVTLDGPQSPGCVVHILAQVCGALDEAHSVHLIHRDIKPANVFLCERGKVPGFVKVVDFGLVKRTQPTPGDPSLSQVDTIVGTPLYLSPEAIVEPDSVDHRSDLYSLGAVAYYLVTGTEVFRARSLVEICGHHLHTPPDRPSERLGRAVPTELEAAILGCLEKDPARRPQTAEELGVQLRKLACGAEWTPPVAAEWWTRIRARPAESLRRSREHARGSARTLAIDWHGRAKRG